MAISASQTITNLLKTLSHCKLLLGKLHWLMPYDQFPSLLPNLNSSIPPNNRPRHVISTLIKRREVIFTKLESILKNLASVPLMLITHLVQPAIRSWNVVDL